MEVKIPPKVLKYETFVNNVLKEDLRMVHSKLDLLNEELNDLMSLRKDIELLLSQEKQRRPVTKTQMDVGCNFYVQANVARADSLLLNVGLLHFVEVSFPEALKYVDARTKWLREQVDKLRKDSALTKAHIKLVLAGLHQLQTPDASDK
ncbi:protein UXT [Bacillus rossius redtenbacheri]|uniref:protein UXT n=1 Tax=Bacillus rossius redtenbacheri TaxID=93214 RepID=UPI002FDE6A38